MSGGAPLLALGEGEEAFEQPVDLVELAAEPVGERGDLRRTGPGLAIATSSEVRIPASGVRSSCGGVRDELALERERALEPVE